MLCRCTHSNMCMYTFPRDVLFVKGLLSKLRRPFLESFKWLAHPCLDLHNILYLEAWQWAMDVWEKVVGKPLWLWVVHHVQLCQCRRSTSFEISKFQVGVCLGLWAWARLMDTLLCWCRISYRTLRVSIIVHSSLKWGLVHFKKKKKQEMSMLPYIILLFLASLWSARKSWPFHMQITIKCKTELPLSHAIKFF